MPAPHDMQETSSTCCYCGVGCGIIIQSEGGRIIGVRGDPAHPANFGHLCTKGSTLHLTAANTAGRALYPEMRARRSQPLQRVGWGEALRHVAERFAAIIRAHGPTAVAFYISGQLLTEDYYVFNKLAKGLIGTNNIDSNSRLCMSSAVSGYKTTLGADAPPACYEDIDHAACLFIAGSNTAYAHPVLFRRIEEARSRNPAMKMIVVDPRRTETAYSADLHLPILPGTDVALFNGMLHVLLWEGLLDYGYIFAHTEGFDELKATLREYTPKLVADICGVPEAAIVQAALWFSQGPTLSLYCQGLNQSTSGTDKNAALINLHLATGNIGKAGAGPLSLTGQPNAMGGREVGAMANLLSAHRDLANPTHRAEVARLWGVDSVPGEPGKTAVDMFEAIKNREIKAVWIACTNPAQSMPDLGNVHAALEQAELVVLQEAFRDTETVHYADVLLPASTWGEKEGTVTNSERRITHVKAAVAPPGEARADWRIVTDFANHLGSLLGRDGKRLFPYESVESIFNEHRATTRGYDLDISGLSYALLDTQGPQQWPFPDGADGGRARLYTDGAFPRLGGRARFANTRYKPVTEKTDARYPLHLNTGRLRDQWHGMSRTGRVARLFNHVEEPVLSMHPDDMALRRIASGELVKVSSRRGSLVLPAQPADDLRPTQTFLPMHWGGQWIHGTGCNALTLPAVDTVSGQPELKHAAVKVEKLELRWRMVAMRRYDRPEYLTNLRSLLPRFAYASCGLVGRDPGIVVLRAADAIAPDESFVRELDALLDMADDARAISYQDRHRGIFKRIVVDGEQLLGVYLLGEILAANWIKEGMIAGRVTEEVRCWALAPVAAPPAGSHSRGRIVCTCLDVSEQEIHALRAEGADLATLQSRLQCGTECGSCVPELKRLLSTAT